MRKNYFENYLEKQCICIKSVLIYYKDSHIINRYSLTKTKDKKSNK